MQKLTRDTLYSLEKYAQIRAEFRANVMAHKKNRQVAIGPHATLYFEDRLTMQYQVQEMLRAERIFEGQGIEDELAAYNPLIPDGSNWKATFMLEYLEVEQRRRELAKLRGIEDKVWVRIGEGERIYATANEDLERTNAEKTSAVHFLRFELSADNIKALQAGGALGMGTEHSAYLWQVDTVPEAVRRALLADLIISDAPDRKAA